MFEYPMQIIVYVGLFIRNVVTPLLLSGYYDMQKIRVNNQGIVNLAIFLMLYETAIIFIVLSHFFKTKNTYNKQHLTLVAGNNHNIFSIVLIMMVVSVVGLWLLIPEIRHRYDSIFNINAMINLASGVNKDDLAGSSRGLFTVGIMLVNICRYLLSAIVLFKIRRISEKKFIGVCATIGVLFLNLLFISTEVAVIFYIAIYLYLVSTKLWPEIKNVLLSVFATSGGIGICLLAFAKSGMKSVEAFISSIGTMLQAYFPGVFNLCGIIIIPKTDILKTIFADIYSIIPFRNSIFGLKVENTADLFNSYNGIAGQIVPLLGESYHLFGIVFAPLLSGLFVYFGIQFSKRMSHCDDIVKYAGYSLAVIYLSVGTTCYNFILVGQTMMVLILPIFLLSLFSHNKYYIKGDKQYDVQT